MAFSDIDDDGEIDDIRISDNGDRNKILATIAKAVDEYTNLYPRRWVLFLGSTSHRTRLYRMAIAINLAELQPKFDIYGQVEDEFIPFYRNMPATAFLVRKKIE